MKVCSVATSTKKINLLSVVLTVTLIYLLQISEELCSMFQEGSDDTHFGTIVS